MSSLSQPTPSWGAADRAWMRRALGLALRSLGATAPNPPVGCVLVRDGRLIGAGRHRFCGGPHAEIEALEDCRSRGEDPRAATAYVSLAPCTRHGRTPPCCDALIAAGVAGVVAALADPIQDDAGAVLGAAGVAYGVGCEAELARQLLGGWLLRVSQGRPRVTAKWAMSLDGLIAGEHGPHALSSAVARMRSRRRRRRFDAIVIGAGTAALDNPQLLALSPPHPARVVISAGAVHAPPPRLVATINQAPLWLVHSQAAADQNLNVWRAAGAMTIAVVDAHDPRQVLAALADRGCSEVLVEGGAQIHGAYLAAGIYDRIEMDLVSQTLARGCSLGAGGMLVPQDWRLAAPPQVYNQTVVSLWDRREEQR
ncbi:MAG: bifunctional diaminohydroxyphosphoribosylaminopyrimidine deaminase/5-amino-6-(5-phosphoribosylamino)uracil reductase RibD [Planctomycetota bacterium]|nr:MAG: bifunctional diaminohydroxyphosphoribosylaminopyrimidine deaminase/5-amino-6-(5-phosphoribosylamino)uracil reductase RibD [Planctomycetota bacterium]